HRIATIRVRGLTPNGIATLQALLDTTSYRRNTASAVTIKNETVGIPVRSLMRVLKIHADDLQALVEYAAGRPVIDKTVAADAAAAIRRELHSYAQQRLTELPELVARFDTAQAAGEDTANRALIDTLARVLQQLPFTPPVPLAKLAHDTSPDHNPHYLDLHTRYGTYLVAAVAERTKQPEPSRPDHVRALLKSVGIIGDRLTSTVLVHNIRVLGTGPIDHRLRDSINPVALTLLDLTETPPQFAPQILTVVENPSLLELARIRDSSQALACTSGYLGSVDHALLQLATDQGLRIRYAGDLDHDGLQIADAVRNYYGAELIAMDRSAWDSSPATPVYQEHDDVLDIILGTAKPTCCSSTSTSTPSSRDTARRWLLEIISTRGTVVDQLPAPMTGRRSPSGWFLLVDGLLVLPLALGTDDAGQQQWIATNCLAVPRHDRVIDPTGLNGSALLAHVRVTTHAIERFQQRGGGHPDLEQARAQLIRILTPTVYASPRPPAWWRSREPADYYLIGGDHDEWCLPIRPGDAAQAFDATTCMHRATHLFELDPRGLAAMCCVDEQRLQPGSRPYKILQSALAQGAVLSWYRPHRARPNPWATWWLILGDRLSAAVSYDPDHHVPLTIRDLDDRRVFWKRWFLS
ncbi:uncharacterized protein (TIGR02679 family), partial [Nocardia sp. GAS34]|uniref:TIGR02679 domain-containing protein n=1 Tax=unclassified Nocardia TaxID=2637762 RepID=UPI003D2604A8